jgi:hypothetical protein
VGIQVSFDPLSEEVEQNEVFAGYFGVAGRRVFAVLGKRDVGAEALVETAESVEDVDVGYEGLVAAEDVVETGMEASGTVADLKTAVVAAVGVVMASDEMGEDGGRKVAVVPKETVVETEAVSAEEMAVS